MALEQLRFDLLGLLICRYFSRVNIIVPHGPHLIESADAKEIAYRGIALNYMRIKLYEVDSRSSAFLKYFS